MKSKRFPELIVLSLLFAIAISCGKKCEIFPLYFENAYFPFPSDYIKPDFVEGDYSPAQSMIVTFSEAFERTFYTERSTSPSYPVFLISLDSFERIPVKAEVYIYDTLRLKPLENGVLRIRPIKALEPGKRYIFGVTDSLAKGMCESERFSQSLKGEDRYHLDLKDAISLIKREKLVDGKIAVASIFTVKDEDEIVGEMKEISHTHYTEPSVEIDSILRCTGYRVESQYCADKDLPEMIVHGHFRSTDFINYGPSTLPFNGTSPRGFYDVPFILAVAKGENTPVVIFQHGFGDHKEAMFRELAYTLAREGFSVIGMDIVFHGERKLPPHESQGLPHLDIMAVDLESVSVDIDRARDHVRQTLVDQIHLARVINEGLLNDPDNDGVDEINGREIYYVGQSLGGILGTMFTALFPHLQASVINVGGGSFIDLLEGYKELQILFFIFTKDMNFLSRLMFFEEIQWKMDKADPANYARHLIMDRFDDGTPPHILFQEAVNDAIVANDSTEFLVRSAGVPIAIPSFTKPPFMDEVALPVSMNVDGKLTSALFQFYPATHGFLLTPVESEPWREAQEQIVHFFKYKEIVDPYER